MKISVKTNSYNQRRYGKPWIANVKFSLDNPHGVYQWGTWLGSHNTGSDGELIIDANEGDIVASGQKDFRNPKNTKVWYYHVEDGKLILLPGKSTAYHLSVDQK